MTELEPSVLVEVCGGKSWRYDPAACGAVTSTGALAAGFAAQAVARHYGIPNIGFLAGAATGGGLFHHYSDACH